MEDSFKNKFGFTLFIIFVLALAVGGFFYMRYTLNDKDTKKEIKKVNYKIDKKKDYIYYENDSTISESAEIYYRDVVINLQTQETLTESLKKENRVYKNTIKYINADELISNDLIKYNNDNIYSLTFREYENYEYNNYVSLLVKDYNYSCFDNVTFTKVKGYIFDVTTGNLLEEKDILKLYDLNMEKIKNIIKEYLESKQTKENDVDVIKIDETINNLDNYAFYINNYGRLFISYLVKTTQVDYNEITEVK